MGGAGTGHIPLLYEEQPKEHCRPWCLFGMARVDRLW
jgi:hypothetical protein